MWKFLTDWKIGKMWSTLPLRFSHCLLKRAIYWRMTNIKLYSKNLNLHAFINSFICVFLVIFFSRKNHSGGIKSILSSTSGSGLTWSLPPRSALFVESLLWLTCLDNWLYVLASPLSQPQYPWCLFFLIKWGMKDWHFAAADVTANRSTKVTVMEMCCSPLVIWKSYMLHIIQSL